MSQVPAPLPAPNRRRSARILAARRYPGTTPLWPPSFASATSPAMSNPTRLPSPTPPGARPSQASPGGTADPDKRDTAIREHGALDSEDEDRTFHYEGGVKESDRSKAGGTGTDGTTDEDANGDAGALYYTFHLKMTAPGFPSQDVELCFHPSWAPPDRSLQLHLSGAGSVRRRRGHHDPSRLVSVLYDPAHLDAATPPPPPGHRTSRSVIAGVTLLVLVLFGAFLLGSLRRSASPAPPPHEQILNLAIRHSDVLVHISAPIAIPAFPGEEDQGPVSMQSAIWDLSRDATTLCRLARDVDRPDLVALCNTYLNATDTAGGIARKLGPVSMSRALETIEGLLSEMADEIQVLEDVLVGNELDDIYRDEDRWAESSNPLGELWEWAVYGRLPRHHQSGARTMAFLAQPLGHWVQRLIWQGEKLTALEEVLQRADADVDYILDGMKHAARQQHPRWGIWEREWVDSLVARLRTSRLPPIRQLLVEGLPRMQNDLASVQGEATAIRESLDASSRRMMRPWLLWWLEALWVGAPPPDDHWEIRLVLGKAIDHVGATSRRLFSG